MQSVGRALLSVHDKTGIVELARALVKHGAEILSTGGTQRALEEASIPVTPVSRHTGAPEILGGRVKTLHPKIAGGLLAVRSNPDHQKELAAGAIAAIDLVACNLYPFEKTVANPGVTLEEALENIDIGGPTMIRAAAKNHPFVASVTDPGDYQAIIEELDANQGALSDATRQRLARRAFAAVARYDAAIASWLSARTAGDEAADGGFPDEWSITGRKVQDLRYGENPHQRAAFYRTGTHGFGASRTLQGKELSFNNLVDLDAAVGLAQDMVGVAAVVVKHTNPCGAAVADTLVEAYRRAKATDPVSAFGGVVALTRPIDAATATELVSTFIEVVAAPEVTDEALAILAAKKALRVIEMPFVRPTGRVVRTIAGGMLVQDVDAAGVELPELRTVTKREPSEAELRALRFAWVVAKHVKSNAIVYANEHQTVGVGAGQMSRVDSAKIARDKAQLELRGTVAASDAFFPFRDGLDAIAEAGATAVIQPGGSKRDDEVIAAADEHGMAMVFTGERHFRH